MAMHSIWPKCQGMSLVEHPLALECRCNWYHQHFRYCLQLGEGTRDCNSSPSQDHWSFRTKNKFDGSSYFFLAWPDHRFVAANFDLGRKFSLCFARLKILGDIYENWTRSS